MHDITLICTEHRATGACTHFALYRIIETLSPEVIFEEIPLYAFDEYYRNKTRNSLETDTILLYLEKHQIEHIPVDYDIKMPQSFWDNNRYLFEKIEANSSEYRKFIDWHTQYLKRYGFKYLNSIYCDNLWNDCYNAMKNTLQKLNDDRLFQIYKTWNDIKEKREIEMIKNIYSYSQKNIFNKGIFFIGAAHRESIMRKIQEYEKTAELTLNWIFNAM
jgi:hypothetical protein